jgi:DNA-binding transcriptional MerR regulator
MVDDPILELAQLAELAGVSPRTIRYYVSQGLLPAPASRGPGPNYTREHLVRLRAVKALQREHLPLAEIRRRLEGLSEEEVLGLANQSEAHRSSALDYVRSALARLSEEPASIPVTMQAFHAIAPQHARLSAPDTLTTRSSHAATRSQWDRIELAQDIELHIRRPLTREQNKRVDALLEAAGKIFRED